MASIKGIVGIVVGAVVVLLHVWYRGVLAVPTVKRRKAATRASRRA